MFKRGCGAFDIFLPRACQGGDAGSANLLSYGLNRRKVSIRGDRKSSFKNVHTQLLESMGHRKLFRLRHAAAGGLFTVTKSGIEKQDAVLDQVRGHSWGTSLKISVANY
jgi:hypothetical protein